MTVLINILKHPVHTTKNIHRSLFFLKFQLRNLAFGKPASGKSRPNKGGGDSRRNPSDRQWEQWKRTDAEVSLQAHFHALAPGRCGSNFKIVIFNSFG